ncbi:MAG: hypothetical protein ACRD12_14030 [Acidimicrobiales bacterium]
MTRGRLWALAGVVGAALALASPFAAIPAAASGLVIGIDSPGTGETISQSSTVTISGAVRPEGVIGTVNEVSFQLLRGGSVVDSGSSPGETYTFSRPVALNGLYTVKITARGTVLGTIGELDGYADRDFAVAVPPARPSNVAASVGDDRRVTLTWTGVSYPDLRGYAIYRKVPGGNFVLIGGSFPGVHTFTEGSPSLGGDVQYQVASLRNGAVASDDADQWLRSAPFTTSVHVPAPPAAPVGSSTTLAPPGGPNQPADASNVDLGDIFNSAPSGIPSVQVSPTPTIPDTGYSGVLPFTEGSEPDKVGGRVPGRPSAVSADGELTAGQDSGSSTNRRALLVPVAAGSVLCVAALHLRWLNRRLAAFPTGGGEGGLSGDLEPADLGDAYDVDRLPVGAGK